MAKLQRLAASRAIKDGIMLSILLEAFFIGISNVGALIGLGVGTVLTLFRLWKDPGFHLKKSPFHGCVLLYLVLCGASILVSPDKMYSLSIWYVLVWIYFLTFELIVQNVSSAREVRTIFYALGAAAVIVVAYGFVQYIFGIDTSQMKWVDGEAFPELRKRVFSTWENPNILAAYLDIVICILMGLFSGFDDKKTRVMLGVGMLCAMACLAMTYARGACLTIAVIMAVYGAFRDRRILIGVMVAVAAILALDSVLLERMKTMFTVVDTSSEMRIAMWESTVQMIMDHPLLGIGGGAYFLVYPIYDTYIVDGSVTLVHAHNVYLNYIAEIGIVGGMCFLVFFLGSMISALTLKKLLPDTFCKGIALGLGLALVSVALNGLTDDVLFNIPSSMLLWMMCGLIAVLKDRL